MLRAVLTVAVCLSFSVSAEAEKLSFVALHAVSTTDASARAFVAVDSVRTVGSVRVLYREQSVFERTGVVPRGYTTYAWTATCTGVAMSPEQIDEIGKICYSKHDRETKFKRIARYLTTRYLWSVPGTRDYAF